jgi:hypothetical protein
MKIVQNIQDIERIFLLGTMLDNGIVPYEDSNANISPLLSQLSKEDARKARRKFRKLWRKAMTSEAKSFFSNQRLKSELGVGNKVPTTAQIRARKIVVLQNLFRTVVVPAIKNFKKDK